MCCQNIDFIRSAVSTKPVGRFRKLISLRSGLVLRNHLVDVILVYQSTHLSDGELQKGVLTGLKIMSSRLNAKIVA